MSNVDQSSIIYQKNLAFVTTFEAAKNGGMNSVGSLFSKQSAAFGWILVKSKKKMYMSRSANKINVKMPVETNTSRAASI